MFLRIPRDVYHVFGKDRWLIIGKGYDESLAGGCRSGDLLRRRIGNPIILRPGLRNFPVLTALALKRTSGGSQGISLGPRQKMIKGFLLYGIDMDTHRPAINEAPQPSVNIHARAAFAPLAITDDTVMGAQETSDGVVFVKGSPVSSPGSRPYHLIYGIACESNAQVSA
jgi:hypothetical protein